MESSARGCTGRPITAAFRASCAVASPLLMFVTMRDHEPLHASFEASEGSSTSLPAAPPYESVRELEAEVAERYSQPSLRYIDIHERPTLIP